MQVCCWLMSNDLYSLLCHYRISEFTKELYLQPAVCHVSQQHDPTMPKHNWHGWYCDSIVLFSIFFTSSSLCLCPTLYLYIITWCACGEIARYVLRWLFLPFFFLQYGWWRIRKDRSLSSPQRIRYLFKERTTHITISRIKNNVFVIVIDLFLRFYAVIEARILRAKPEGWVFL